MKSIVLVLPFFVACSSSYMRESTPTGPPGPTESKVIFYRTSLFGAAITFPIYEGERLIGFTEKGAYFETRCAPGEHLFISWGESDTAVAANLAPGKTYYVKSYARMGFWSARPGLQPIVASSDEWPAIEDEIRHLDCREVIPEKAEDHMKRRQEKAQDVNESYQEGKRAAKPLRPEDGK